MSEPSKRVGRWILSIVDSVAIRADPPPDVRDTDCRDCRKIKGSASIVIWADDAISIRFHANGTMTPPLPDERDWDCVSIQDKNGNVIRLDRVLLTEALALMDQFEPRYRHVEPEQVPPRVKTMLDATRDFREAAEKALTAFQEYLWDGKVNADANMAELLGKAREENAALRVEVEKLANEEALTNRPIRTAEAIITLLSVAVLGFIRERTTKGPWIFHFPAFFSAFGASIRALPNNFGYDAGLFNVVRDQDVLTVKRQASNGVVMVMLDDIEQTRARAFRLQRVLADGYEVACAKGFTRVTWDVVPAKLAFALTELREAEGMAYGQLSPDCWATEVLDFVMRVGGVLNGLYAHDWHVRLAEVKPSDIQFRPVEVILWPLMRHACDALQAWRAGQDNSPRVQYQLERAVAVGCSIYEAATGLDEVDALAALVERNRLRPTLHGHVERIG